MMRMTILLLLFCMVSPAPARAETPAQAQACALLDTSEVVYLIPAAVNAEIRSREKPYPSCTFIWPTARPVQKTIGGHVMEFPGEGRLTITVAGVREPDADWRRVIASYGGQELLDVPAVGKTAVWSAQRRQLSVLAKLHIVHVALENTDGTDTEYENAVRLALLLVDKYE